MRIDLTFLPALAATFMLVFARIGSMVMLMPAFGESNIPTRVKLSIALMLTLIMLPLHRSAAGRALVLELPEPALRALLGTAPLERFTPRTITTLRELRRELDASRARGYTVCDEEIELGVRSIAVPILDRQGATIAALTISTRAERMTVAEMAQAFLPALLRNQAWARNQLG